MSSEPNRSDSNPFATRYTRPGAIEYLFPAGESAAALVARLGQQGWRGEIVGPHGSGKSTLVAALVPELVTAGRTVVWRQLRGIREGEAPAEPAIPNSRLPTPDPRPPVFAAITAGSDDWNESTQLVLDGYEQLSWWWRRRVEALCRRRGAGLLVTTHQPLGLPPLARTEPSQELAQQVVERLLEGKYSPVGAADVSAAYAATGGNLRETLFALYDVHQSRR